MSIHLKDDIHTIQELKNDSEKLIEKAKSTGRPLVITVGGKSECVLVDAAQYQLLIQAFNMTKALLPAEEDYKQGLLVDAQDIFDEFRNETRLQG